MVRRLGYRYPDRQTRRCTGCVSRGAERYRDGRNGSGQYDQAWSGDGQAASQYRFGPLARQLGSADLSAPQRWGWRLEDLGERSNGSAIFPESGVLFLWDQPEL